MSFERAFTGILAACFLVAYVAWRWRRAGHAADALDAERLLARQSFEQLKGDPRFLKLQRSLDAKYRTTFEHASDPTTYCIRYLDLTDARCQRLFAPNGAGARYLIAYLERRDRPARIQVSLDLQTGVCGEMELGWMSWSSVIPAM